MENIELEKALAGIELGECIDAVIRWKDEEEPENVVIAMHPDDGESDDGVFFYCESVDELRELLNPDNGEDFVVIEFTNGKVTYSAPCDVSEDTKATLTYGEDGMGSLTIAKPDGTKLYGVSLGREEFRDLKSEFTVNGRRYTFNFFDQPDDYGVGCWIYPDGDTDWEVTAEVEVYEGGKLVRTNQ